MSKRRDCEERFCERYSAPVAEAALIVEREVIGANVGANGYTTVAQADMLAQRLELRDCVTLLDIGSGRGWPGLYLAANTGCSTVLMDLPKPALAAAIQRADDQGLSGTSVTRASATNPPFRTASFDAITHTDTLCCVGQKLSVLRACKRLLRQGGMMGFFTIFVPAGLSGPAYARALRSGPSYVSTRRRDHKEMLESAGFEHVEEVDQTPEFLVTTRAWLNGRDHFRDELVTAEGQDRFEERQLDSRLQAEAIEAGLFQRAFFVCS